MTLLGDCSIVITVSSLYPTQPGKQTSPVPLSILGPSPQAGFPGQGHSVVEPSVP